MADADYTYHVCSVEGCGSKSKALGFCLKHYMQSKRKGLNHYSRRIKCSHCGDEFEPTKAGAMYCSKRCKQAAWKAANVDKHDANRRAEKEARPKYSAVAFNKCNACSKLFVSRRKRMYCCDACKPKTVWVSTAPKSKTCLSCGSQYVPIFTGGSLSDYCGDKCRLVAHRATRRIYHAKRKAMIRGATVERVDPFAVFERDKWKCKLCGCKTPSARRGTYYDDAPELDHIVPLSVGGEHSYRNTQCACRKCNGLKSDKPMGQMLLIG